MAWQLHEMQRDGKPVQWMLDDRFRAEMPGAELPRLIKLRVGFAQTPGEYFWHPDESAEIDQIEDELMQLTEQHGDGWVVFVQRRTEAGGMDFYFYAGEAAKLEPLVPELAARHTKQRFTMEETADPAWAQYSSWLAEAADQTPDNDLASDRRLN